MEGYAFNGVNNFRMDDFNVLDAAQRLIDELQKEYDRMTTINVVVAGKTGSGKSTLINNVFREKMAETGTGMPITQEINKIEKEGFPLRVYDTPGLELGGQNSTETLVGDIQDLIEKSIQSEDPNQAIHCVWYCINTQSSRIEQTEMDFIKTLVNKTKNYNVPVIIILTQAYSKKKVAAMREAIQDMYLPVHEIVPVLAEDVEMDDDYIIKAYGLDKLVEVINYVLPTRVKDTFVAIQTASLDLKKKKAQQIVKLAAAAAAITGAVPIPFSDAAILVPTQISMLVKITSSFGLSVEKAAMVGVISATIGTTGTTILGKSAVSNLLKFIPGAGTVIGGAISGATAAALTASLGEAYIAIMIKVTKGEMEISDLATSKGQMELKNEFERQMKVKRDKNGEALEKQ